MTSVKFKFRLSKVERNEGVLYYQVIRKRRIRQFPTAYTLLPEEWNDIVGRVICDDTSPRYSVQRIVSDNLQWDELRFERVIRELDESRSDYTAEDVMKMFRKYTYESSVFHFIEQIITQLKNMNCIRLVETYTTTLNSLRRFREGQDFPFEGFTSETMQYYQAYLKTHTSCMNTVSFYMRILRAVYNRAVEKGIIEQRFPFRYVYTGIEKTVKRAVSLSIIKTIKNMDLSQYPAVAFARDIFLFSFYTRGMSFVDIAYLRRDDIQNGMLVYRRRKTGQRLTIQWESCMEEIVKRYSGTNEKYVFSIITDENKARKQYHNAQHRINYNLKILGRMLKLRLPLTMYVARHSWASVAKSKHVPLSVISEGLGHDSESTTQIYLSSLKTSLVNKANRKILNLLNC